VESHRRGKRVDGKSKVRAIQEKRGGGLWVLSQRRSVVLSSSKTSRYNTGSFVIACVEGTRKPASRSPSRPASGWTERGARKAQIPTDGPPSIHIKEALSCSTTVEKSFKQNLPFCQRGNAAEREVGRVMRPKVLLEEIEKRSLLTSGGANDSIKKDHRASLAHQRGKQQIIINGKKTRRSEQR